MENNKNFASKCSRFVGNVMVVCLNACVISVAIALTVRFITWLF